VLVLVVRGRERRALRAAPPLLHTDAALAGLGRRGLWRNPSSIGSAVSEPIPRSPSKCSMHAAVFSRVREGVLRGSGPLLRCSFGSLRAVASVAYL
jgi:hypothetical protein